MESLRRLTRRLRLVPPPTWRLRRDPCRIPKSHPWIRSHRRNNGGAFRGARGRVRVLRKSCSLWGRPLLEFLEGSELGSAVRAGGMKRDDAGEWAVTG